MLLLPLLQSSRECTVPVTSSANLLLMSVVTANLPPRLWTTYMLKQVLGLKQTDQWVVWSKPSWEGEQSQGDDLFSSRLTAFHPTCWAGSLQPPKLVITAAPFSSYPYSIRILHGGFLSALQIFLSSSLLSQLGAVWELLSFSQHYDALTTWKAKPYGRQDKGHLSWSLLRCEHLTLRLQFSQAVLHMLLSSLSTRTEMDSCVSQNNLLSLSSALYLTQPCMQNIQRKKEKKESCYVFSFVLRHHLCQLSLWKLLFGEGNCYHPEIELSLVNASCIKLGKESLFYIY